MDVSPKEHAWCKPSQRTLFVILLYLSLIVTVQNITRFDLSGENATKTSDFVNTTFTRSTDSAHVLNSKFPISSTDTTTSTTTLSATNTALDTISSVSVDATNSVLSATSTDSVDATNTAFSDTSTVSADATKTALPTTSTVSVDTTKTALPVTATDSADAINMTLPTTTTGSVDATNTSFPATSIVSVNTTKAVRTTTSTVFVDATKTALPTISTANVDATKSLLRTTSTARVDATKTVLLNTSTVNVDATNTTLPITSSTTNTTLPTTTTGSVDATKKALPITSPTTNTTLQITTTGSVDATKTALPTTSTISGGATNSTLPSTYTSTVLQTTSTDSVTSTKEALNTRSETSTSSAPKAASADLPESWRELCTISETFVKWNFTTLSADEVSGMTQILCYLKAAQHLKLTDYRNWVSTLQSPTKMAMKVVCNVNNRGAFHVPWPMKIKGLVYLEVYNCNLADYYSEYFDQSVTFIPDQFLVLGLINCVIQTSVLEIIHVIKNVENMVKDVECGPLSLEKFAIRNLQYDIEFPDYVDTNIYDYVDYYSEMLWLKYRKSNFQCNFRQLLYIDESYFQSMSGKHLFTLQAKSFYPELKAYNLSHVGFHTVPIELSQWRRTMEKLVYLDLSHNHISEIDFIEYGFAKDGIGMINLQYNNIKQLRRSDLESLQRLESATIDIRNNLINCSCGMVQDFREFLRNPDLGRYEYLRDLRCGWPEKYSGKRVSDLTEMQAQCTEGLFALTGVLGSLVLILAIIVILLWRFRREVVILVYTRLNILLPCQAEDNLGNKDFDAFISYSSKDDDWVLETLVKKLENQEDGWSGFKLCVHHRDFEIGAAIADNVVRSVESSRHTVMVLSRNFVESEWCIYEFRTAMQQSLIERRKHLILVILEDVPKSELDPDLRKCLETFTYIQAGETLFWDKLRYTLSVRSKQRSTRRSSSSSSKPSETEILKSSTNNNIV